MPNILWTRIDNRLIHGQVAVTWSNHVGANLIVVANDEVAKDPLQQSLMDMAVPGLDTRYFTIQETIDKIGQASDEQKIALIVKTPQDALKLVRGGVPIRKVNIGNMHTFATLIKGHMLYGLFEHHTGGITAEIIQTLVSRLQQGNLDAQSFAEHFDGHGAAIHPEYRSEGPFTFVAVTGPNRAIAAPLGYHQAAPYGDMMLTGAFGLVEGVRMTSRGDGQSDRDAGWDG